LRWSRTALVYYGLRDGEIRCTGRTAPTTSERTVAVPAAPLDATPRALSSPNEGCLYG
jgi:hypothetical protein